jgi:hypothetical protein
MDANYYKKLQIEQNLKQQNPVIYAGKHTYEGMQPHEIGINENNNGRGINPLILNNLD